MKKTDVEKFEKTQTQLHAFFNEISTLSKKAPNDAVNKFKLKFINQVLLEAHAILGKKGRPFEEFKTFEEDDLPSNSDVTFILSQYLNCMEGLRALNIKGDHGYWYWVVDGETSSLRTSPPEKLRKE